MVLTKANKDNRLARQQLHWNHVVTSSLKNSSSNQSEQTRELNELKYFFALCLLLSGVGNIVVDFYV